jgi:hypothetical protein
VILRGQEISFEPDGLKRAVVCLETWAGGRENRQDDRVLNLCASMLLGVRRGIMGRKPSAAPRERGDCAMTFFVWVEMRYEFRCIDWFRASRTRPREQKEMLMGDDGKKDPKEKPSEEKPGPVRTQMVGEAPGEDLGYDPNTIPTEEIVDDDEEPSPDA